MKRRDPLDAAQITSRVAGLGTALGSAVEVFESVDSTNTRVAARLAARDQAPLACLADAQSAGRGRRGRAWVSPPGCNLYLSVGLRSAAPMPQLSAFALVVAAELATLLECPGISVKWPNDLLVGSAKLGGILCENAVAADGSIALTVGIGLNVAMPEGVASGVDREWTTLERATTRPVARGELAARIIHRLCVAFPRFGEAGLRTWIPVLRRHDCLAGHAVRWREGELEREGCAAGIADDGALRVVLHDGRAVSLHAGDVTLARTPRSGDNNAL